jgi:DNA-binding Lrp family transcriptional regulator
MKAYILVKVLTGHERDVFDRLSELRGLEEIHYLFGDWDYLLSIRAADTLGLSRIITQRIRKTPGIAQTTTLLEAPVP